jgi:amidase
LGNSACSYGFRLAKDKYANDHRDVVELFRNSGANVVHAVYITPPEEWLVEGGTNVDDLMDDIMRSQARAGCDYYLRTLDGSDLKTLEDIIAFNESNADNEFDDGRYALHYPSRLTTNNPFLVFCPDQIGLLKAQSSSMSAADTAKNLAICKRWAAIEGVDKVMPHGVDVIVAPCDSFFAGWRWEHVRLPPTPTAKLEVLERG